MHQTRYTRKPWWQKAAALAVGFTFGVPALAQQPTADTAAYSPKGNVLIGRAVLPAATFAPGPTSGQYLGAGPINKQAVPFVNKQPVQGFSSVLDNQDGTFLALTDNGFGSIENSADYHLRVYTIRPRFERKNGGKGDVRVRDFIELHDPDQKIPFAIVNHFTTQRILTGADFDVESFQRADDGTLWFGDEFGPFLLHTDAFGKVLEAPIPLPDFDVPWMGMGMTAIRGRFFPFLMMTTLNQYYLWPDYQIFLVTYEIQPQPSMKRKQLISAPNRLSWRRPLPGHYRLALLLAMPLLLAVTAPAGLAQTKGALIYQTYSLESPEAYPQTSYILETEARGFGPTGGASPSDSYNFLFGKAEPGVENYYRVTYFDWDWIGPSDSARLVLYKVFREDGGGTGSVVLDSRQVPRFNRDLFYTFRVEREGKSGSIKVFLNDAPMLAGTDATYQALGTVSWRIETQAPSGYFPMEHAGYEYLPAGAGPVFAEAEDLTVLARSGDVYRTFADPGCSGDTCAILDANAAGDFFTYRVEVPEARRYAVKVRVKKYHTRGTFQLAIAGKPAGSYPGGFVNHGPRQDLYAASPEYLERTVAYVHFASAGTKQFRFTVTGRNRASHGYTVGIDAITLVPDDAGSSASDRPGEPVAADDAGTTPPFAGSLTPDADQPSAFPNPFQARTTIAYQLRETTRVRLVVHDKTGNPVQVLVDELQAAGRYRVPFEAGNLPKGLYEYRLQAGSAVKTRKVLLVK